MKQWFRKAALCFALALSVLTLAACGSSTKDMVEAIDPSVKSALEEQAKQYAEQSIYALSDAEIESQIKSAYKTKDEITYNGLTNYLNDKDRLGAFVSVDDAVASKTEDGYSIEINSTFEKRTLKLTLGLNELTGKTTEMTFEPHYSLAEQMEDAGANLAVGMGTVFVVLIFIAWVISLFKYISVFEKKMKGQKAPAEAPKAAAPAPKAAAPAPAAKQDDVMQAVIAAAIAAYEADTAGEQGRCGAAINAVVAHFVAGAVIAAHAVHERRLFLDGNVARAEQLRTRFGARFAAGRTQPGLRFALRERRRIAGATGKAARAAVCARKHL